MALSLLLWIIASKDSVYIFCTGIELIRYLFKALMPFVVKTQKVRSRRDGLTRN